MTKYYLGDKGDGMSEGDTIYFSMPPFCSGEYAAKVYRDDYGLYIDQKDNFFDGARDGWRVNKPYWSENYSK